MSAPDGEYSAGVVVDLPAKAQLSSVMAPDGVEGLRTRMSTKLFAAEVRTMVLEEIFQRVGSPLQPERLPGGFFLGPIL